MGIEAEDSDEGVDSGDSEFECFDGEESEDGDEDEGIDSEDSEAPGDTATTSNEPLPDEEDG